jgi:hypothetical protein
MPLCKLWGAPFEEPNEKWQTCHTYVWYGMSPYVAATFTSTIDAHKSEQMIGLQVLEFPEGTAMLSCQICDRKPIPY